MAQLDPQTPFAFPIRVYWEDTDAGGIVFYANYLKFFERARTEWLRSLGVSQQSLRDQTGGMFVVMETRASYHLPARLDDRMLVTARIVERGRAALTLQQAAYLVPPGASGDLASIRIDSCAMLCEGSIRIAWVDASSLRPTRMPPGLMAVF